ncbi:MAG TPA: 2'-5' RNA ligase family protein [Candidatus Saccharimonadales bacterium]|nr:2'-5' RNA ligase family protein [Candidatus Saccharimonadales bacterium]
MQSLINKLAKDYGSTSFVPHLSLVAGLMATKNEVADLSARISKVAQSLGPFTVTLSEYGYKNEEHRCLYLLAEPASLTNIYSSLSESFPQVKNEHFEAMPHLSVLYGHYPESTKQQIIADNPYSPKSFEVSELSLFLTNGSADNWRLVQEFSL